MLSLSTGRMVNRDHFRVMPMPESVIKRMNELALADGRKKGKGVPTERTPSYTQDDGGREGLPDTIEVCESNGVDPSVVPMEEDEVSEQLNDQADERQEEIGDMTCDALDLSEPTYTPSVANVRTKSVEMDELIGSMSSMEVGPYQYVDEPIDGIDSQGVPVDSQWVPWVAG